MSRTRTNRNIDIRQERERFDKAAKAFKERENALQQETGRLVIEKFGFTSTKQVVSWLEQLAERRD
ncbi:hypothetical protein [Lactiplantibacillus plantarum]|uniref:hypothetical protein n=1 Tax=Lactiplantibacillus plantarum TaxID=1590 RepID=UPI001BA48319|nr:hypothetical protein [Lactiplantibacillus plantarum]MBS0935716.1 hypothetical protein [Lactiplantibacillus plantarum]MBS0943927.1 hypothetical protein [Lactiplantibacillus plantarum]MBS0955433.1 hypothetical protein [Lactiplantibacillus plantarum]